MLCCAFCCHIAVHALPKTLHLSARTCTFPCTTLLQPHACIRGTIEWLLTTAGAASSLACCVFAAAEQQIVAQRLLLHKEQAHKRYIRDGVHVIGLVIDQELLCPSG